MPAFTEHPTCPHNSNSDSIQVTNYFHATEPPMSNLHFYLSNRPLYLVVGISCYFLPFFIVEKAEQHQLPGINFINSRDVKPNVI